MRITETTPPTREPISVDEMQTHGRITGSDLDPIIRNAIVASRRYVEEIIGRALINRSYTLERDTFADEMRLPYPPLSSVTQIQYVDTDGDTQTLSSDVYTVDTTREPGLVRLGYDQSWPATRDYPGAVTIEYVAGYGDGPEDVPEQIKIALMSHAMTLIDNPSMIDYGMQVREVPHVFERLLAPWRNYL